MPALLALNQIKLSTPGHTLLDDFSLTVTSNKIVTIMGPSGCGKSTLLAYICGTLAHSIQATGEIRLNDNNITLLPPEQRRVGILFQDDLLFPHLSVADNLLFGLKPGVQNRSQKVEAALAEAELSGFGQRDPTTLSGGQRARVALMRTLLAEPAALLLDEPFSKLDSNTKIRLRRFVFDHAREQQLPTLLVTHDRADAKAAGGRVIEWPFSA